MKTLSASALGPLLALCLITTSARPGVDRSIIPAQARWLVHVEVQASLQSQVFGALQQIEPDLDLQVNVDLQEVRDTLGLDLTRDIAALTAYGLSDDPEAAVILLHTHSVVDQALIRLAAIARRQDMDVDGLTLSRWSDRDDADDDPLYVYLARHAETDDRIVVISRDPADVVSGVQALRGEIPTLADGGGNLGLALEDGALVHVSASGQLSQWEELQPASNIARMVRSAVVEFGERGPSIWFALRIDTSSVQDATRVVQILQGAMALASLASQSDPETRAMLSLLAGLHFEADGATVTLRFEHDTADLLARLQDGGLPDDEAAEPDPQREPRPQGGQRGGSRWY